MSIADEPAYPTTYRKIDGGLDGLTKRELFAAMAMQGMCSEWGSCNKDDAWPSGNVAEDAVEQAYALCAQLSKGEPNDCPPHPA